MTREELRRRGTLICRGFSAEVATIAPAGIGHEERVWDSVAEADADFMAALTGWEAEPSDEAKDRVRATYRAVIGAWRRAVAEFEREEAER